MRVSVVIPCFNAASTLRETLDSVFLQTLPASEVIVVDDGSTDATPEIIRSYGNRVRSDRQSRSGASEARNRGTLLSAGDCIQYLDSDDLLTPDSLEKKIRVLTATGADAVYSDWRYLNQKKDGSYVAGKAVRRKLEDQGPDAELTVFNGFWAPPAAILYSRDIVTRVGSWSRTLPFIQDARFMLDALHHGARFAHVPEVLAHYRVSNAPSLSRRNPRAFRKDLFTNTAEIEKRWLAAGPLSRERREALADSYYRVARDSYDEDPAMAEAAYAEIAQIHPGWRPVRPAAFSLAVRCFGYRGAQSFASRYRRLKKMIGAAR